MGDHVMAINVPVLESTPPRAQPLPPDQAPRVPAEGVGGPRGGGGGAQCPGVSTILIFTLPESRSSDFL